MTSPVIPSRAQDHVSANASTPPLQAIQSISLIIRPSAFVILPFALAAAMLIPTAAQADGEIKIGFTPPLTGLEHNEGEVHSKALSLAVKQLNDAGGIAGKKIKLVVEDNKSTPAGALEAYEKVIDKEKVVAVIGSIKSGQVVAMLPKSKTANTPTIIGGTNPRLTAEGNKWLFRTRPDDNIAAAAMVKFIKDELRFTKIGVLHDLQAFGKGGGDLVEKFARENGVTVVKREMFTSGLKDYSAHIKALKEAGAQIMISYVANNDDQGYIEADLKKAGSPFPFMGSPSSTSKPAQEIAKDSFEGIYSIADFVIGESAASKKYEADYRAEYKTDPDAQSVYTYDGLMILADAIKKVGTNPDKIREHILGLKNSEGVEGKYTFSANGDGLHQVSIVRVQGGKPKLLKVIAVQ